MINLYYVGFNGYQQCPNDGKTILPKVTHKWLKHSLTDVNDIECTFRNVIVKTTNNFIVYGLANDIDDTKSRVINFPVHPKAFLAMDDFLFVSESNNIWKSQFGDKWSQIELFHTNDEELALWTNQEIIKLCFLRNKPQILMLSGDGAIWKLTFDDKLSLVAPPNLDKAVDISCGFEHCLILTTSGRVLSFGNSSRGQCGHGDLEPVIQPLELLALGGLKVLKIAAGGWHSCAITDSGDLFVWGWNNFGQLTEIKEEGAESNKYDLTPLPILVDLGGKIPSSIIDVACGVRHTVILTENNEIYSTGWNEYGQLGIDSKMRKKVYKFMNVKLPADKGMKKHLRCGPWSTLIYEEIEEAPNEDYN